MDNIKELLAKEGIDTYGIVDFDKLTVINPRLLPKEEKPLSALILLIPYRRGDVDVKDDLNMGLFARIPDYHGYFRALAVRLAPTLKSICGGSVYAFADHSPIKEKDAARLCGLGFIGNNSLLVNPVYGSFVFIGCFLFTVHVPELIRHCDLNCGNCTRCAEACPAGAIKADGISVERCLSALSQKKRKTDAERAELKATKTFWGCDICQNVCPYNAKARLSPIEAFSENVLDNVKPETIRDMDDATFGGYAFSYRGKQTVEENFLTDGD